MTARFFIRHDDFLDFMGIKISPIVIHNVFRIRF